MLFVRWIVTGFLCLAASLRATSTLHPKFLDKMKNVTAVLGADVQFTCSIKNLGNHKVAWFHVEKKQVIAVHKQRVSSSRRYQLYHSYPSHWVLKIKGVRLSDQGHYMCQINTVPMITVVGFLKVQVPPDIIDAQTSSDVEAVEGANVTLFCKAFGIPVPKIVWKREDSKNVILYDRSGKRHAVKEYPEEKLHFYGVSREHMGAYLCIATNGVPPPISRRISLSINFPPVLQIQNQLIGAPINSQVSLTCIVQAHPKSIIYWTNSSSIIGNTAVFTTKVTRISYKSKAELIINNVQQEHFGAYRCNAENPYGKADGIVRLYELQQGSDSRSRLRINGNGHSDSQNLADRTEQAMSVREDLRKSGSEQQLRVNKYLTSVHIILVLMLISMLTSSIS